MIGGTGLFVLTLLLLFGSMLSGTVTMAIGRSAGVDGWVSFTWGAVLGPLGLIPVIIRARRLNVSNAVAADAKIDW